VRRAGARLTALLVAAAAIAAEPAIEVNDPWISEAPPGTGVAAAYLEIRNGGETPATLIGASSPRFDRVEMHESGIRDGMASMRRLEQVEIPPQGRVAFAPGGGHFMLFGKPPLPRAGEDVPLALQFADGTVVELSIPVRRGKPDDHAREGPAE